MKFPSWGEVITLLKLGYESVKLAVGSKKKRSQAELERQRQSQAANAAAHRASVEVNKKR